MSFEIKLRDKFLEAVEKKGATSLTVPDDVIQVGIVWDIRSLRFYVRYKLKRYESVSEVILKQGVIEEVDVVCSNVHGCSSYVMNGYYVFHIRKPEKIEFDYNQKDRSITVFASGYLSG